MKKTLLLMTVAVTALVADSTANAQSAVLSEIYGRGVHAYYTGNHSAASELFSMAINSGSEDPRAYYFRGMSAYSSGNTYQAESDWQRGAELEAAGRGNAWIGRSLARFQGSGRLKLEQIRQKARLQALALQASRSQQRMNELQPGGPARVPAPPTTTMPAAPAVSPPPAPPNENPFSDDMAIGEAEVTEDDALKDAMNPIGDAPTPAGDAPAADSNPFGGTDDSGGNPFGGGDGDAAPNPFGDSDDSMEDNPFGDNPFGS